MDNINYGKALVLIIFGTLLFKAFMITFAAGIYIVLALAMLFVPELYLLIFANAIPGDYPTWAIPSVIALIVVRIVLCKKFPKFRTVWNYISTYLAVWMTWYVIASYFLHWQSEYFPIFGGNIIAKVITHLALAVVTVPCWILRRNFFVNLKAKRDMERIERQYEADKMEYEERKRILERKEWYRNRKRREENLRQREKALNYEWEDME